MNREMIQEEVRKENEAQTKDKNILKNATKHKEHDMLRMMEHDVNLGMT